MSDYDDSDDAYDSEEEWLYMEDVFDEAVGGSCMQHMFSTEINRMN